MLTIDLIVTLAACGLAIWLFVMVTRRFAVWSDVQSSVVAIFALVLFLLTIIFAGVAAAQPLRPTCNTAVAWLLVAEATLLMGLAMLGSLLWQRREGAFSCYLLLLGPVGIVLLVALMLGGLAALDAISPNCWS